MIRDGVILLKIYLHSLQGDGYVPYSDLKKSLNVIISKLEEDE